MARVDASVAGEFIAGVIQAAGGEISHNDLIQQLDAAGNGDYATLLPHLRDDRKIKPFIRATGVDTAPVLMYKLPGS